MRRQATLRLAAIFFVMVLLTITSCTGIMLLQQIGPAAQVAAQHPEHIDGTIVSVTEERSFVLRTASGTDLQFSCGTSCHASLWHIQRHVQEQAHTDVWYESQNHQLQALYVD